MKKISLTGKNGLGKFALVDSEVYPIISSYSWMVGKDIYPRRGQKIKGTRKSKTIYMHRQIIEYYFGKLPRGKQVDHINMNRLDNRICNLRIATRSQNHMNMNKNPRNTTGQKGVVYIKRTKSYWSRIKLNQKQIHLGSFKTPQQAAHAYNQAATKHFGEFARLNSI